jgi:TatD DNase family protein
MAGAYEIVDTHCHIHEMLHAADHEAPVRDKWLKGGRTDPDAVIADAVAAGVTGMICIGTDVDDSALAVDFVQSRPQTWAAIGIHPHEAKRYVGNSDELVRFAELATRPKVVAVGECGLDYFYGHSPKADQQKILRFQMELALQHDLPMTFHVREAFDDFWPIFDSYKGLRGVVHSFTASRKVLDEALARGLYIALNGIVTFSKDEEQLAAARAVPLENLLVETDAPFLTPAPFRGKICEPKHVATTLAFVAQLQDKTDRQLAEATTANARRLFNLAG